MQGVKSQLMNTGTIYWVVLVAFVGTVGKTEYFT